MNRSSDFHTLASLVDSCLPGEWGADPTGDSANCVVYRATDIDSDGHLTIDGGADRFVLPGKLIAKTLRPNDIVLEASGGAPDKPVGRVALFKGLSRKPALVSNFFRFLRPRLHVDGTFLTFQLVALNRSSGIWRYQQQTTGLTNLKVADYLRHRVWVPHIASQQKIAAILTSLDTAIEKTEALIEKHQQIKAGLMRDLFTRGVLPNGQLRPPREQAPEVYRDTSIGHMPTDWSVREIGKVVESIVDGPFGSNLKTEHYVVDAGVRVVRLQNVSEAEYDDSDKAYISEQHARCLVRNKVVTGDVLIAGLGDERYPVGRACCYPARTAPAVNKADCFRARCNQDEMRNTFLMLFLNSEMARRQTRRFEQGVTRPRINTGNLKRLNVCVPSLGEQDRIIEQFELARSVAASQRAEVEKLRAQKAGLMQDLLTGKVPVKVADTAAVPA